MLDTFAIKCTKTSFSYTRPHTKSCPFKIIKIGENPRTSSLSFGIPNNMAPHDTNSENITPRNTQNSISCTILDWISHTLALTLQLTYTNEGGAVGRSMTSDLQMLVQLEICRGTPWQGTTLQEFRTFQGSDQCPEERGNVTVAPPWHPTGLN